jgi:hypothetical protein
LMVRGISSRFLYMTSKIHFPFYKYWLAANMTQFFCVIFLE